MAFEIRLEATVLGPGRPGQVKVTLRRGQQQFVADVPVELLPSSLRIPNSEFVAVVKGQDVVSVEPDGQAWLTIQNRVRDVLNRDWDPIGVAEVVADEYDMYIGQIHSLLAKSASEEEIAESIYCEWKLSEWALQAHLLTSGSWSPKTCKNYTFLLRETLSKQNGSHLSGKAARWI